MKFGKIFSKFLIPVLGILVASTFIGNLYAADGHCNYVQENMFAGPFQVCTMPTTAEQCEETGNTDDNHDAVHGDGDCSSDGVVGTCDLGDSKLIYYEGDPGGLEIGCGFQGGEWIMP